MQGRGLRVVGTGIPLPLVDAQKEIVVLSLDHGRQFLQGNDFDMLRVPLMGHRLAAPFFRGERRRRGGCFFGFRFFGREGREYRQQREHKDQGQEFPHGWTHSFGNDEDSTYIIL